MQRPDDERIRLHLDQLAQQVRAIQDSDSFRRYLDVQARFHKYSFNNVLLIAAQYPDASQVAGFNTWKALDRHVRKGEKAIRILAPLRRKDTDSETGEEVYRVYGYRTVPVFALEQTEGKEFPQVTVPQLMSDDGAELYGKLEALATDEGLRVQRGHPYFRARRDMMGFYEPPNRLIAVRENIAQLQATKTLAHELGHHFAKHTESGPASETEAEAVSYVVLKHHGLDSGERSFPYVAVWAQDTHVLRQALGTIQRISTTMIARLHPQDQVLPLAGEAGR